MKHLLWLLCVLLVTNTVSAQEGSTQNTTKTAEAALAPLVIEVRAQRITRSALSEALLKELRQTPAQGEGETPQGALELSDAASDTIRLTYRDATGRETTRDLFLAPDDPEALEKITIAAANLVRDQMSALSQLEAARRAEEEAALAALVKPVQPAPAPAKKAPVPVYDPCHPPLTLPFGVDLAWLVGTSSTPIGRQAARRVSIGLAGTYSGGTRGIELSILANIDRRGTCGLQMAAALNVSIGDVRGVQLAIVNATFGHVRGLQLGITNLARKGIYGAQLGVTNISLAEAGLQLAVTNIAWGDSRVQLGVANIARGNGRFQLGVANVQWGSTRAQIGVLNVLKDEARFQLGVINYAGKARAPIGVISIVRDGRTSVDAWVNENGSLLAMLTHGGDRVYNMYGAGTRVGKGGARWVLAWGIAAVLYSHPTFNLDLQAIHELYPRFDPWQQRAQVGRLRLAADVRVTDRISLIPAVGWAVMIADYPSEETQAPFGETVYRDAGTTTDSKHRVGVYGFPTFGLGLRVMLSGSRRPRE